MSTTSRLDETKQAPDQTIFVVDDREPTLRTLQWVLGDVYQNVRTFQSPCEFLDTVTPEDRGAIVLDIRMDEMNGHDVQRRLASAGIQMPVIVFTALPDAATPVTAARLGCFRTVLKLDRDELLEAISDALKYDKREAKRRRRLAILQARVDTLSDREREVWLLIVQAYTAAEIGRQLHIAEGTVSAHSKNLQRKMQVDRRIDLVRIASELGLVDPIDLPPAEEL